MFFAQDSGEGITVSPSATVVPLRAGLIDRSVAVIGTFPPRKCGIATFTADLVQQTKKHRRGMSFSVWSVEHPSDPHAGAVSGSIICDNPDSYIEAARAINATPTDAVWLQHEFGIFGGPDGEMVLDLADRVAAPLIVTFHTVLEHPSDNQRRIIDHLVRRASRIMVMSPLSRERLIAHHHAAQEIVEVIEHGAPDRPFGREKEFKASLGLADRPVLTTFGLLGPGKGLETVIEALPQILQSRPDTLYRIVGATHPNLVAQDGESYRDGLQALAKRLGVEHAIVWENRYLETGELLDQLEACDIYLTPYPNLQQSTSGTLSYAVALGKAVVSTPYSHARELLADGVGRLVEPKSSASIAAAVCALLDDPAEMAAQKRRAYERGRKTIWPQFAEAVGGLIERAIAPAQTVATQREPSFEAVRRMSDATGMFQHAIGVVPDRRHGYCLDDNVRALMLTNSVDAKDVPDCSQRAVIYASFIQHAWNPDIGAFRNFMRFDRAWCEDRGSDDSNGRTIWALGCTARDNPDPDLRQWAEKLYDQAIAPLARMDSPRALAFVTLGAAAMLCARPGHGPSRAAAEHGGKVLAHLLDKARRPDWPWFEALLAYDNPRMPQALIAAGEALDRKDWIAVGLETLAWICERQTAPAGHFRPIGSESFGLPYDQKPFDQQPLEAQAALDACAAAHALDGNPLWRWHGLAAWNWFFGANDRGVMLADPATGLCRDGIGPQGANLNCGAESILAFQLGYRSMLAILRDTPQDSGKPVDNTETGGRQSVAYS